MARIPREVVDAVRERVDLVALVERHVKLTRRGNSFVGLCPFHQEKTPSFHVIPSKNIFHCFGCSEGGDCYKFVQRLEGLSFYEAVVELGEAAGIEVRTEELSQDQVKDMQRRATLYDALEAAASWYESRLWTSPEAEQARAYLEDRGITQKTANEARIGWAPGGWTSLVDHLHRKGLSAGLLVEAGLAREGRRVYDTFRERVVFPIRDDRGRVIGMGGRILEGDGPKYINSPETRLYQKSRVLYGLHLARKRIQQTNQIVVVEGYFDVISLHQAGFGEAVATCGTALTPEHMERIRRLSKNLVLLLDADEAGSRAAERSLPLAIDHGLQAWRLQLPDAKDPDELIREHGAQAMQKAMQHKAPLVEWVVQRKLSEQAASDGTVGAQAREQVLSDLLPLLQKLPDTLVSRVAAHLGVHESSLHRRIRDAMRSPQSQPSGAPDQGGWRPDRHAVHLLWLLTHRRDQTCDIATAMPSSFLASYPEELISVVARLMSGEPVAAILESLADPGVQKTMRAVVVRESLYTQEEAALGMCQVLAGITEPKREAELRLANRELADAAANGDPDSLAVVGAKKKALLAYQRAIQQALTAKDTATVTKLLANGPKGAE